MPTSTCVEGVLCPIQQEAFMMDEDVDLDVLFSKTHIPRPQNRHWSFHEKQDQSLFEYMRLYL